MARGPLPQPLVTPSFAFKLRPTVGGSAAYRITSIRDAALYFGEGDPVVYHNPISVEQAVGILDTIEEKMREGLRLLTWSGTYYDLAALAQETRQRARVRALCRRHTDILFHVMSAADVPLPLSLMAQALGFPFDAHDIASFVRAIHHCAARAEEQGEFSWEVQGKRATVPLDGGWMSVETAEAWARTVRGYAPMPQWMR